MGRRKKRWGREEEVITEEQVELTRELRNRWCLVTFAGASSLHSLGFADRRGEWQRREFECLKVGGELSLTGDVNEKPLNLKMNSLMAIRLQRNAVS